MSQSVQQPGAYPYVTQPEPYSACGGVIDRLMAKPLIGLGVTQIVIGVLCIIFNIVGLVLHLNASFIGHGIWCSCFFILAGAFGIASGVHKKSGFVVTCMVLSIFAAIFTVPLFSIASIAWALEGDYNSYSTADLPTREAMHAIVVILGLVETVISIVTASLCCHGICCCGQQGRVLGRASNYAHVTTGMHTVVIQGPPAPGFISSPQSYGQPIQPVAYQQQPLQAMGPPAYTGQPGFQSQQPPAYQPQFSSGDYGVKA